VRRVVVDRMGHINRCELNIHNVIEAILVTTTMGGVTRRRTDNDNDQYNDDDDDTQYEDEDEGDDDDESDNVNTGSGPMARPFR
jgi:hypothetical protein